jgi:hypothetical protein
MGEFMGFNNELYEKIIKFIRDYFGEVKKKYDKIVHIIEQDYYSKKDSILKKIISSYPRALYSKTLVWEDFPPVIYFIENGELSIRNDVFSYVVGTEKYFFTDKKLTVEQKDKIMELAIAGIEKEFYIGYYWIGFDISRGGFILLPDTVDKSKELDDIITSLGDLERNYKIVLPELNSRISYYEYKCNDDMIRALDVSENASSFIFDCRTGRNNFIEWMTNLIHGNEYYKNIFKDVEL